MRASQRGDTMRGDKGAGRPADETQPAVLLLSTDSTLGARMRELLESHDYAVVECGARESPSELIQEYAPDVILIAEAKNPDTWASSLKGLAKGGDCPPVVAFGSPARKSWRGGIPDSLVLARLSSDAAPEDQLSVVAAAIRHRKLQIENRVLRSEAEQLCSDLVSALGETSEKLTKRNAEVLRVEGILRDAEARILKVFS